MYAHGRGRIVMQAVVSFEETRQQRTAIVVTELPFQVNKASLAEKIADLVQGKKIEGIADIRDESDRDGMRLVIECKRDAAPRKVLNNLFKHTALKMAFNMNMLALVDGQPQTLPLKQVLQHHIDWRREVVRRRTEFDLAKARDRAHILEGLKIALDNLDAVIRTIRESADVETARQPTSSAASSCRRSRPTRSSRCSCGASPPSSARRSRTSTWPRSSSSPSWRTSWPTPHASWRSSRTSCAR